MMIHFILAYLLGSISPSYLLSMRIFDSDLTKLGSGNLGSTNMSRNFGRSWGLLVLALDALKGLMGVYLFGLVGAIAVIVGHCNSIFLEGKGGKGVATSLGVLLYLDPHIAILALISTALLYSLKLEPFIAHIGSMLFLWVPVTFMYEADSPVSVFLIFATVIVFYKHRPNIEGYLVRRHIKSFFI